jgi:type II secretory ATPase GspE/PulE/Tfp pilus assembly ATPase PilB-like protein
MSSNRSSTAPGATMPRFLDAASEETRARQLAERLGLPYVDLWTFRIDAEIFRSIPLEWMLRFEFVPEKAENGTLSIVMADPADVIKRDELEGLLKKRLRVQVGSRAALHDILQKSESTQRVLEEATEEFRMEVVREDEEGQEVLSIDRITADASPIIKLVDSVLFNAIQRRASDIHIETQEHVVVI